MKKGFIATLFVAALCLPSISALANAPIIYQLPDVTVGDAEDNHGTDSNFFVYTDAFKFDDYVQDTDTPFNSLLWSFDEYDSPAGTAAQWYQVNGKNPLHDGDAAMAADDPNGAPHNAPGANELRSVSNMASFRDIVFSPAGQNPPFPTPTENHAQGKFLRFYVSDGTKAASSTIMVKSVDEGYDSISGGVIYSGGFTMCQDDAFTTNSTAYPPSASGWQPFDFQTAGFAISSWNASTGPFKGTLGGYQGQIVADATHFRATGHVSNGPTDWLAFNRIGTDNYVRAKYYMYAYGLPSGAGYNVIPNIRIRVSARYAYNSMLEILAHSNGDPAANTVSQDVAPSTDQTKPSLYRVDLAPIFVPYTTVNGAAEGIQRAYEAYSTDPQDSGYIVMTESVIGIYPASMLGASNAKAGNSKIYATSASDAGDLKSPSGYPAAGAVALGPDVYVYNLVAGTDLGGFASLDTVGVGTYTEGPWGVRLNTGAVASTKIGLIQREFFAGSVNSQLVRISENETYKVRWHITSTQATNKQSGIRLRARTAKFNWTQKFEVGGAWATGGTSMILAGNNAIAQQVLPGAGCQNPDIRDSADTNAGGWYTLLMDSPLSQDIRPDVAGSTILAKMPHFAAEPGPGSSLPTTGASLRDLKVGCENVDSLSGGGNAAMEQGDFTIDRIEVTTYNMVDDGGY